MKERTLDAEIPALKIGKSAEALFQDDIGRFAAFMQETGRSKPAGEASGETLCIGALETLDDKQWERAKKEFFTQPA